MAMVSLQFVRLQEHDGKGPLVSALSTIRVELFVCSILLLRCHRTRRKEGQWQHIFIADDRWPRRIALESREVVLARLCIEMSDFLHRFLFVELLALVLRYTTCRLALAVRGLFGGRRWRAVGFWSSFFCGRSWGRLVFHVGIIGRRCSRSWLGWLCVSGCCFTGRPGRSIHRCV